MFKDEQVDWSQLKSTELLMNRTAIMLEKMFAIGQGGTRSQKDRICKAVIAKDTPAPTMSFLWKTHKSFTTIPPTRPVCNATCGPIARTSSLLTLILTPIMEHREFIEGCDSTEDMLNSIQTANQELDSKNKNIDNLAVWSMDPEAVLPILGLTDILKGIWRLVTESEIHFNKLNMSEISKYLAVTYSKEEITKQGIEGCIPVRQVILDGTQRSEPTLAYLDSDVYTRVENG